MTPGSQPSRTPITLQIIVVLCILCAIILIASEFFWYLPGPVPASPPNSTFHVKILGVNDFHGHLPSGQTMNNRPVGSAPVLASYLKSAITSGNADGIIIAFPGDVTGGSPPESGLLLDEPTMLFFNDFANENCTIGSSSPNTSCNMVATLGNQEFNNNGVSELMRMINGGNGATNITHLVDPYPGAKIDYVCTNVVWKANNTPIVPPYTLRYVDGVPIAFIGAVTRTTPEYTSPANVEGVAFLDEADSINRYIPEIQQQGVHAIVVLLHEGGNQTPYEGPTRENETVLGEVTKIIPRLDPAVDVVLSAHTHEFTNAYLNNSGGKPVLVTQAFMYGRGYSDVDLIINRTSGEIVEKSAQIIPTYADQGPGKTPDPATTAFLAADEKAVAPIENQIIGIAARNITRDKNSAGESAMGDMVADGERAAMNADVGFDTSSDLWADVSKGNITWSDLYAVQPEPGDVQPVGMTVLSMTLSGEQILNALEQQWREPSPPNNLIVSGLVYTYNISKPAGSKVTKVTIKGVPMDPNKIYTVATVGYLAGGGDNYTVFKEGRNITYGPTDVNAFVAYVESLRQPVNVTVDGRIQEIN